MKARRLHGGARLSFTEIERSTLASLLDDLAAALAPDGLQPGDPVHDRLYPDGYSGAIEPSAQEQFRDLIQPGLRSQRLEHLELCRNELGAAVATHGRVEVDADGCDRWLRVLNDLRLSIGTRLEISDDDDHRDIRADGPAGAAYLIYGWLTEVQDTVVRIALK